MADPKYLLPWLVGGAIGAGGLIQGLHWRSSGAAAGGEELQRQLEIATEENEALKRENASLRSLAQGGGEFAVPQEAVNRVEKEFGLRFLSGPVVHRIAGEELRDRISAAYESRFGPAGIEHRQEAYQFIGWLREEDRLLAQLTAIRAVGARGWFDDASGEGWVTDRFNADHVPDQAALLRLLARILLHQHFPPPPAYPGDDAARAREALHQGAASGSEARFYAENARQLGFMPMKEDSDAEQLLMSLPSFIQGLAMFSVIEGKSFSDTKFVQGEETLMAAFRNPPQTTQAILDPAGAPEAPAPLELPAFDEEPFLIETAGALGLRLWLEPLGDVGAALQVASGWENDRYALFPDGEASSAVLWDIEVTNPQVADELEALARGLISATAERDDEVQAGEIVATGRNRHLAIVRLGPAKLRFLNTALAATAERFQNGER